MTEADVEMIEEALAGPPDLSLIALLLSLVFSMD